MREGSKAAAFLPSRRLRLRAVLAVLAVLALALAAFAVAAASASAETAEMGTISNVSYSSARVTGKVTTVAFGGHYSFEYATSESGPWVGTSIFSTIGNHEYEADLTGLEDGTRYFVRLTAEGPLGSAVSPAAPPYPSFTTLTADPPSVESTEDASEVEYTQAQFTGHVVRPQESNDLTCNFEYITDVAWQANPAGGRFAGATPVPCDPPNPISAVGPSKVEAGVTGLTPSTTYHLRLVVSNAAAEVAEEAPDTFTTLGPVPAPTVGRVDDASEVEFSRALVKGEVSRPAGKDPILNTECAFEYITDAAYASNPVGERFVGASPVPCEPAALIEAAGPTPVEAHLTGLAPQTTYHLRLVAANAGGTESKESVDTFTTEGPVAEPTVLEVGEATEVGKRSAEVSGEVERPAGVDPAFDVECQFEYVTDAQFQANPPGEEFLGATPVGCGPEDPITSPEPGHPAVTVAVSAELGGLEPGTTYHLRLTAKNAGGTVSEEAPSTFTTLTVVHPTLSVDSISEVGYTSFTVTGTADPGNQGVWPYFEYAPAGTEEWAATLAGRFQNVQPGSSAQLSWTFPCSQGSCDTPPLKPGTTYQVRMSGTESETTGGALGGEFFASPTPYPEITTKGTSTPPSTTLQVTDVTGNSAHISATVDTHAPAEALDAEGKAAYQTDWHFECTPGPCPAGLSGGTVTAAEGSRSIEIDAKSLEAKTHYEIKLVAHNSVETIESEVTFDTLTIAPTVTALPGGPDGEGGYTLAGVVNPNNLPVTACEFKWGPNSAGYAFAAPCSPPAGGGAKPVTVEAHLSGLNPGAVYHFRLFATNGAGTGESNPDLEFTPTLAVKTSCPNEQLREENNSLALPECRAYEMVTDPNKEGNPALFLDYDDGDALAYESSASNIANSGDGRLTGNTYVATRTALGWETIPNLNGPTGSLYSAPEYVEHDNEVPLLSSDLLSSIWTGHKKGSPAGPYLRRPDGRFVLVGLGAGELKSRRVGASGDLSHVVYNGLTRGGAAQVPIWGTGVYEFIGIGNDQPRRIDVNNSDTPVGQCGSPNPTEAAPDAFGEAVSTNGRVIVFKAFGGCGGTNPPANEIWARVEGTTSYDLSASRCDRTIPGDPCNAPSSATFQGVAKDGSRVYFTTTQQMVNGDTDETKDLYACDIPTTPQVPVGTANPCSALREVSAGSAGKADVQQVLKVSDDGSTAYFTARGVLAGNVDALGEEALAGDENLYVWRTDAAHPDGQTNFVARLPEGGTPVAETTPDGHYLVLQTAGRLLASDTDESTDIYRYDAVTGELLRVSTAVSGAGGNGEFDAHLGAAYINMPGATEHHSHPSISDNGKLIVFATEEPLSPLDGNGEADAYLWNDGRALGSVAPLLPTRAYAETPGQVFIDGSGQDIYVQTAARLNPTDVDAVTDVYDVRVDGGFPQHQKGCAGETCQPSVSNPPATVGSPANRPNGEGNIKPKTCPKGKVVKGKKCVKKHQKKHKAKHHKKHGAHKHKRAGSNHGGGK